MRKRAIISVIIILAIIGFIAYDKVYKGNYNIFKSSENQHVKNDEPEKAMNEDDVEEFQW